MVISKNHLWKLYVYTMTLLQLNTELTIFVWQSVEKEDMKLKCLPEKKRITRITRINMLELFKLSMLAEKEIGK